LIFIYLRDLKIPNASSKGIMKPIKLNHTGTTKLPIVILTLKIALNKCKMPTSAKIIPAIISTMFPTGTLLCFVW